MKCFLLSALLLLSGLSCLSVRTDRTLVRYAFEHGQMGTVFRLVFYASPDSAKAASLARRIFSEVDSMNAVMSDYLPESELSQLGQSSGAGKPMRISPHLYNILGESQHYAAATGGAFDATIGPLTRLWRRARSLKELPDSARIDAARALVDYRLMILIDPDQAMLTQMGMRLDLGGIAQGYAADVCLSILHNAGIRMALVDAGGDIAIGDAPPNQPGWQVEVPGWNGTTRTLSLSNTAITTSGATYKYLEANGIRYSHIIDPRTGWGITRRRLVTVQAPNAIQADALATAVSVLGSDGWEKIKKQFPQVQVTVIEE